MGKGGGDSPPLRVYPYLTTYEPLFTVSPPPWHLQKNRCSPTCGSKPLRGGKKDCLLAFTPPSLPSFSGGGSFPSPPPSSIRRLKGEKDLYFVPSKDGTKAWESEACFGVCVKQIKTVFFDFTTAWELICPPTSSFLPTWQYVLEIVVGEGVRTRTPACSNRPKESGGGARMD